jgi:hypothetical protein
MLPVKVTLRADRQIQKAASWWLANRPKAPEAFKEDFSKGSISFHSSQESVRTPPT